MIKKLGHRLASLRTAIIELAAAFEQPTYEGPRAYVDQVILNTSGMEEAAAAAAAATVVSYFCERLLDAIDA